MAVETLTYQGINRAPTDYAGLQCCEELINLRPTQGGVVPVKEFDVMFSNVNYDKLWIHHTTDGDKYIAVIRGTGIVEIRWIDSGSSVQLCKMDVTGETASEIAEKQLRIVENISYATAGNIILFSLCDVQDSLYKNCAFTWKANSYVTTEANIPDITISVSSETLETAKEEIPYFSVGEVDALTLQEYVDNAFSAAQENNPDVCFGPVVYAIAYKTNDGSIFWTQRWAVYDPIAKVNTDANMYVDANTTIGIESYYSDFLSKYGHGYFVGVHNDGPSQNKIYLDGVKVKLNIKMDTSTWSETTSMLQSVEVYTSRPNLYADTSDTPDGYNSEHLWLVLPQKPYSEMDLGGQILYHQASIPIVNLNAAGSSGVDVPLSFGGTIQVTEETLDTDAGELKRYGKLLSYNARFHYYDSVSKTEIGMPTFNFESSSTTAVLHVLVRYEDEEGIHLVYIGDTPSAVPRDKSAYIVLAPSIRIKEVITYVEWGTNNYAACRYSMATSSTYNYSICTEKPQVAYGAGTIPIYHNAVADGVSDITIIEKDAINVTEQYNPFVFRVEHSYLAPGNVLDVQPQMAAVVDQSYGTDPLNVFTTRGVYALTQGSANVLYGAFVPISNIVAEDGGLGTEQGTFFLGAGNLWLIAGRRLTLISDALSRGPNKYIRSCDGYRKISGGGASTPLYDESPFVSAVEFDVFCNGGQLSYNRFRDEIYVSNKNYGYTYVISLKYRQWFKLPYRIYQDEKGSTIGNIPVASSTMNIVDFSTENAGRVQIHLQSRPFSMGYRYSHIHRIVAMLRAKLSGAENGALVGDLAVTALYGSDDLQRWTLLAYAKRNGSYSSTTVDEVTTYNDIPLYVSQVRTPSSARSWRYYTVCIGGVVTTDAEIGPVLVDYEPVIRRIG